MYDSVVEISVGILELFTHLNANADTDTTCRCLLKNVFFLNNFQTLLVSVIHKICIV